MQTRKFYIEIELTSSKDIQYVANVLKGNLMVHKDRENSHHFAIDSLSCMLSKCAEQIAEHRGIMPEDIKVVARVADPEELWTKKQKPESSGDA